MADKERERRVYLALKNVFLGKDAKMRQSKVVRAFIEKNLTQIDIKDLIKDYNIDNVCTTAQELLKARVFESTAAAKVRFPEIFAVTPAQSAAREASKAKAAKAEAKAIHVAVQDKTPDAFHSGLSHIYVGNRVESPTPPAEPEPEDPQPSRQSSPTGSDRYVPSLFPVYLPMRVQHRLLVKVQTSLEQACFDFAQRTMPELLQDKEWDCPEAVELSVWASAFLRRQCEFTKKLAAASNNAAGKPLDVLLRSVADIRHTAVHRIRVSAEGIERFVHDAESFATRLGDGGDDVSCVSLLKKLRHETRSTIEEIERNKDVLGAKLEETRKRIATQRAELDQLEQVAITEMLREDSEYQVFAGANLERAIMESEETALAVTIDDVTVESSSVTAGPIDTGADGIDSDADEEGREERGREEGDNNVEQFENPMAGESLADGFLSHQEKPQHLSRIWKILFA